MHASTTLKSALTLLVVAGAAIAGPLDPPAGPISPTYKTLFEVEPRTAVTQENTPGDATALYVINTSGSYYLTGDVDIPLGFDGIRISASEVTLDLNGFTLRGDRGSDDGIVCTGAGNVTVRNGRLVTIDGDGLRASSTDDFLAEDLHFFRVLGDALEVDNHSTLRRVTVRDADLGGIAVGNFSRVEDCTVSEVGELQPSRATDRAEATSTGIVAGSNSVLVGCVAENCTSNGFSVADGCVVKNCTARNNIGQGYVLGFGSTIQDSVALLNITGGIDASTGCTITGCTADRNSFQAQFGPGINAESGSTVVNNTCRLNGLAGIIVKSSCLVKENTVDANGIELFQTPSAGILANGNGNRIDTNAVNSNVRGIQVLGLQNFVVRNSLMNNLLGPFDIAAGNFWSSTNNPASGATWANITQP